MEVPFLLSVTLVPGTLFGDPDLEDPANLVPGRIVVVVAFGAFHVLLDSVELSAVLHNLDLSAQSIDLLGGRTGHRRSHLNTSGELIQDIEFVLESLSRQNHIGFGDLVGEWLRD